MELFEKKKKEYLMCNGVEVSLNFSQKINNKIEKLKSASFLRKEIQYNNFGLRTAVGSLMIEKNEERKEFPDTTKDQIQNELERIAYKRIFIEKKDKEFRKEELKKIMGKGFNSQKIEILLEVLLKEQVNKLLYFHDLFENILKLFINKKSSVVRKCNSYKIDTLILHLISIEENRVLLN